MLSPVLFVLLVASVRADANADAKPVADADAEPFIPYVYPQYNYGNNWAALQFGSPQDITEVRGVQEKEDDTAYRPSVNFLPAVVAPSPFFAIRNVQVRPSSLFHRPTQFFRPPVVLQSSHVRVPDHKKKDSVPRPVTASLTPSFVSQHTAQIPFFWQHPTIPVHVPVAAPSYHIQHTAQIPIFSNFIRQHVGDDDDDDDGDDDVKRVNIFLVPHFPTELASLTSLRDLGENPVIPAGIVQSTQPTFKPIEFMNSKAHPSLLSTLHDRSDSVVEI